MAAREFYVGRYIGGGWESGGCKSDYESDKSIIQFDVVMADNHADAIKKANPKYYRAIKDSKKPEGE